MLSYTPCDENHQNKVSYKLSLQKYLQSIPSSSKKSPECDAVCRTSEQQATIKDFKHSEGCDINKLT